MADRDDRKHEQTLNYENQEDPGTAAPLGDIDSGDIGAGAGGQHNDWGHRQAGSAGNLQPGQQPGQQSGAGGNIGGVPGSQHNDWGHSPVAADGNLQSEDGGHVQSAQSGAGQLPRQGVMPGEEMGHLQRGRDDGGRQR